MTTALAPSRRPLRASEGLRSPFAAQERIRAVLFDLDGTLYVQRRMRALMAAELLTLAVRNPVAAPRRWRALSAYRKAQEVLRRPNGEASVAAGPLDQIDAASERAGMSRKELESLVAEWMVERPLKYLPFCRARGLVTFLNFLERHGLEAGVYSDYPPGGKLRALGLGDRFPLILCSTDSEVGAFKPHPRGFLVACERWGLSPREVLMVGDRIDVDAAGAAAAGLPCVIIGKPASHTVDRPNLMVLASLERLRRVLDDGR